MNHSLWRGSAPIRRILCAVFREIVPKHGIFLLYRKYCLVLKREGDDSYRVKKKRGIMETRIALIGIIVENTDSIEQLNHLLHEYGSHIIGRMGIPYREKGVNIISVAIDAPQDVINALSGKIGRLSGISAKTVYSNVGEKKQA